MKKFRFVVDTGFINCKHEIEEEFEDNVTEEEFDNYLQNVIDDYITGYWKEI